MVDIRKGALARKLLVVLYKPVLPCIVYQMLYSYYDQSANVCFCHFAVHSFAKVVKMLRAQSLYLSYSMYEISYVKYHSDFYNIFCQNTYICQIFNDKAVVERVHLGEVELWHRRLHNRACVAILVESEEK